MLCLILLYMCIQVGMLSCTTEQTLVLSEGSGDVSMGWTQLVSNYYLHTYYTSEELLACECSD
jgi:hypothetical protein